MAMAGVARAINPGEDAGTAFQVGSRWGLRAGSLLAGFIAGAVFWHFVGFWDFVSKVVLADPALTPAVQQDASVAALAMAEANCIALSIDRMRGETLSGECRGEAAHLHAVTHERSDLLPIAHSRSGFLPASRTRHGGPQPAGSLQK